MRLYHFCSDKAVKKILRNGISKGGIIEPFDTYYQFHFGYVWLTTDPDPKNQSWATNYLLDENRTEWRLTVEIPKQEENRVMDRIAVVDRFPRASLLYNGWNGSENWRVYHGLIDKRWIVKAEKMD